MARANSVKIYAILALLALLACYLWWSIEMTIYLVARQAGRKWCWLLLANAFLANAWLATCAGVAFQQRKIKTLVYGRQTVWLCLGMGIFHIVCTVVMSLLTPRLSPPSAAQPPSPKPLVLKPDSGLVVILFLSHDSIISQQHVWSEWRGFSIAAAKDREMLFVVHSPSKPKFDTAGEFLWLGDAPDPCVMGPTSWCSPAIVYEQLRAYRAILQWLQLPEDRQGCVCLVSGNDIPILSGARLFEAQFQKQDHVMWCVMERRAPHQYAHSQWLSLTLHTTRNKVEELLGNNESAFASMVCGVLALGVRLIDYTTVCLDNMWFTWNWTGPQDAIGVIKMAITISETPPGKRMGSPVEWTHANQVLAGQSLWKTLYDHRNYPALFYRKVKPSYHITQMDIYQYLIPMWNGNKISAYMLSPIADMQQIQDRSTSEKSNSYYKAIRMINNVMTVNDVADNDQAREEFVARHSEMLRSNNYDIVEFAKYLRRSLSL